jgi:hypothetical protein
MNATVLLLVMDDDDDDNGDDGANAETLLLLRIEKEIKLVTKRRLLKPNMIVSNHYDDTRSYCIIMMT